MRGDAADKPQTVKPFPRHLPCFQGGVQAKPSTSPLVHSHCPSTGPRALSTHLPTSLRPAPHTRHGARYLADPLVDVEVELPAHIEAEPVAVAALVVDVNEGNADGVGALRVEGHPVGPAILRVAQQLVQPLPGGELGLNLVHLLPSSLRRHLGKEHSSCPNARMLRSLRKRTREGTRSFGPKVEGKDVPGTLTP